MTGCGKYEGQFDGISFGVATGWVRSQLDANDKVLVELVCDGYAVAFGRADIMRRDILDQGGDSCFGYEIRVPQTALTVGKTFWVRVANTTAEFRMETKLRKDRQRSVRGEVHTNGSLTLGGWVMPEDQRILPLTIIVREKGIEISRFLADDKLALPEDGFIPARAKGFRHRLPFSLADGKVHVLEVETADGLSLKGSPVTVAAWVSGAADLIGCAQKEIPDNEALHADMGAFALGLGKSVVNYPVSVRFEDYPTWKNHFGPPPAKKPTEPFTVFIYGKGDIENTRASLALQNADVEVVEVGAADLTAQDWPTSGFVAFVRAGDRLDPEALAHMAHSLRKATVAYSDSDQLVDDEWMPWFKPDWDVFQFISQGYVFGLLAARSEVWKPADFGKGSFTVEEIVVALINATGSNITHCDEVLYHQYDAPALGAAPMDAEKFRTAVLGLDCMQTTGTKVAAQTATPWLNTLLWNEARDLPKVSIIIPTRDGLDLLKGAIDSIRELTQYADYEILIGDNGSIEPQTNTYLEACKREGIRIVKCPGPFNFSAINNRIIEQASGEVLCLLNNDIVVTQGSWLTEMVHTLNHPQVGIVGAKLLWDTEIVQHGGVILGIDGGAMHVGNTWARWDQGYAGLNQIMHQSSCVTAACLVMRRSDYHALGGLDELAFPVTFNDVDLCLRARAAGYSVVWTPQAELLHFESASRGRDELPQKAARAARELANLRRRWGEQLLRDPFYNRNLNRDRVPYEGLALPPLARQLED